MFNSSWCCVKWNNWRDTVRYYIWRRCLDARHSFWHLDPPITVRQSWLQCCKLFKLHSDASQKQNLTIVFLALILYCDKDIICTPHVYLTYSLWFNIPHLVYSLLLLVLPVFSCSSLIQFAGLINKDEPGVKKLFSLLSQDVTTICLPGTTLDSHWGYFWTSI